MDKDIDEIFSKVTDFNDGKNIRLLTKEFDDLNYIDECGNGLYHLVIISDITVQFKLYIISLLVDNHIDANRKNNNGDTFIHLAIQYINDFNAITCMLRYACKKAKYDVNAKNNNHYTILHDAIVFGNKQEDILKFASAIKENGFIYDTDMACFVQDSKLSTLMKGNINRTFGINKPAQEKNKPKQLPIINGLMKYGTILNEKKYDGHPALNRDREINKIIISLLSENKLPLLIGPSGVGKTAIIDELAYHINSGDVPNFLKKKLIYEVNMSSVLSGTKYRGDFENNLHEVINYAIKNELILFIDEFHMVFGAGASDNDKTDAAGILKFYIDRYNLKVIGATTTDEYNKYMVGDALKRRFDVIRVNELGNKELSNIAVNTINTLAIKKTLMISNYFQDNMSQIISILLDLTAEKNRRYDDKVANPDLLISIINRAIAYAMLEDKDVFDVKHLILGIEDSERLYSYAKEVAIKNLNYLVAYTAHNCEDDNKIVDINVYRKQHAFH